MGKRMKKLRLLITEKCNRNCEGCCNKEWDLSSLPICTSFDGYDEIKLTGGEPLLKPSILIDVIAKIRHDNPLAKIFLYTANTYDDTLLAFIDLVDGMTYTIHEQKDVQYFLDFNDCLINSDKYKSLRLNIFKGVELPEDVNLSYWKVSMNRVWTKNCPLPNGEVFMRLQ